MNNRSKWLALMLGATLVGCSGGTASTSAEAPPNGQTLPVSAQFTVAGRKVELEVARTQQQQSTGLMNRTTLPENRGMLFPLQPPQKVQLWMKNVRIPLDMVFLRNGQVKGIEASVPPCATEVCPTYGPVVPVDQIIELPGGQAAKLGLKVGNQLKVEFLNAEVKPGKHQETK